MGTRDVRHPCGDDNLLIRDVQNPRLFVTQLTKQVAAKSGYHARYGGFSTPQSVFPELHDSYRWDCHLT